MRRYILVKNDGDTFVSHAQCLADAFRHELQPAGCPPEHHVIAVVTDRWAKLRHGPWDTLAARRPEL